MTAFLDNIAHCPAHIGCLIAIAAYFILTTKWRVLSRGDVE